MGRAELCVLQLLLHLWVVWMLLLPQGNCTAPSDRVEGAAVEGQCVVGAAVGRLLRPA
jgi:hypothetical protein